MTAGCDREALEALAAGGLTPERARALEDHLLTCPACREELGWLRAEGRLVRERRLGEPTPPPELWLEIERRIAAGVEARGRAGGGAWGIAARLGRWRARAGFGFPVFPALAGSAALAAAVVLVLVPRSERVGGPVAALSGRGAEGSTARPTGPPDPAAGAAGPETGALDVLDAALGECRQAVAVLEGELARKRPGAAVEARLRRFDAVRARLPGGDAGDDPETRWRALDGYADYLRTLQAEVLALEGGGG